MPNITITQLPAAGPITGTELVPIVQNGQTLRTTTAALAGSPVQTQTFLTLNQEPTLINSRYLQGGTGVGLTDNGALSYLQIVLNGASGSLEAAANGIIVKTGSASVTNRSIAVSGDGLSIVNGNGLAGNPTIALTGLALAIAQVSGTGMLAVVGGTLIAGRALLGTVNQIDITNGDGSNSPLFSLASNAIFPGTGAVTIPIGTTAQRPIGQNGMIRYNTDISAYEVYNSGLWGTLSSSGVTSITGTPNEIAVVGTTSVVLSLPNALTFTGKTVTGGTFDMTAATVNALPVVTTDAVQVLTNKTISGTSNTLTNIGNSSLTNSSISFTYSGGISGSASVSLGGSNALSLSNIPNSSLQNSSVTIGTTGISLGGTSLTLAGLTSVTLTQDPVSALQAATKQYVDAVAEGLHVHESCAAATTGTLASITGGTVTYNNGTAGVGATLTLSVALTTLDGYSLQNGDRILVKNEATQANNGIYTWATGGTVLTRATDFDTATEIASGDFTFVSNGTLYANTGWVQTNPVTTVGTDPIVWLQFSGAGTYTAGTGLTLAGSQFSITNTGVTAASYGTASSVPTIAVNAQGQITSASNTSIAIDANQITTGTIDTARISGSYTGITGVGTLTAGTWNASTIGVAYGGTGQTTQTAAFDALAPSTTKGDLIVDNGTNNVRLPVGTDGHVLTADSTVAEGVKWAAGGGSPFTSPVLIDVNSTSNALEIRQIGTGNALLVEDATNPDATPSVIDARGNLILGKTTRQSVIDNKFEVHSTGSESLGLAPSVGLYNWSATASHSSYLSFYHYPSGVVGTTTTANASGDALGRIRWYTQNGAGTLFSATIAGTTASDLASVNLTYTANSHSFSGAITSGTWNGSAIGVAYGGTGLTSGTSGGIPYFSASNAIASSAALTANALVIGGGAGVSPSTTTTGSGVLTALGNAADATNGFTTINGTATLTNKRITQRCNAQTTTASPFAWNSDSYDQQSFSALANALTINADAGTPTDGQRAVFRIKDDGTARALTWTTGVSNGFRAVGATLPTTTVINKTVYVGCIYNIADSRWDVVAVAQEA